MPQSKDRLYRKKKDGQPQGPWYGWYYPEPGGKARYVCLGVLDRTAAARRLRALEREAAAHADRAANPVARVQGRSIVDGEGWTVLEAFEDFLGYGCRDRAESTRAMYVQKARHLLRVLGRDLQLETLTLEDVDAYLRTREREGAHPGTIYKEIVTLRQCLKWGKRRRRFTPDIGTVIPPVKNVYRPRKRHLRHHELPRLLEQLRLHRRWWVIVAIYTAGRRSEIERLRWAHVDLNGGWLALPGTKTRDAERTLPLHPVLLASLQAVPEAERTGPLVQPWPNVHKDLRAACERAGIEPVTPNDLRRTFASWLKQAGEDSMVVARLLGHTTTTMVERVYGHLVDDNFRHAIAKLPTIPEIPPLKRDKTGTQRAQPPLTLVPTHATFSIDRPSLSDLG